MHAETSRRLASILSFVSSRLAVSRGRVISDRALIIICRRRVSPSLVPWLLLFLAPRPRRIYFVTLDHTDCHLSAVRTRFSGLEPLSRQPRTRACLQVDV